MCLNTTNSVKLIKYRKFLYQKSVMMSLDLMESFLKVKSYSVRDSDMFADPSSEFKLERRDS